MKLADYCKERGRKAELAHAIQATPTEISDWCRGRLQVPAHRAIHIEWATQGVVSVEETRPDLPWWVIRQGGKAARAMRRIVATPSGPLLQFALPLPMRDAMPD